MDSKDCNLTIKIAYEGKKCEMSSINIMTLEDMKKKSVEEFKIPKEGEQHIKFIVLNDIEEEKDIINYAKEINSENYELKTELKYDEEYESKLREEKLKQEKEKSNKTIIDTVSKFLENRIKIIIKTELKDIVDLLILSIKKIRGENTIINDENERKEINNINNNKDYSYSPNKNEENNKEKEVKDKEMIKAFREEYRIDKTISDEKLLDILNRNNRDFQKSIAEFFNNTIKYF